MKILHGSHSGLKWLCKPMKVRMRMAKRRSAFKIKLRMIGPVLFFLLLGSSGGFCIAAQSGQSPLTRSKAIPGQAIVSLKLPVRDEKNPTLRKEASVTAQEIMARLANKTAITGYRPLFDPAQLARLKGGSKLSGYFIIDFDDTDISFRRVTGALHSSDEIRSIEPILRMPVAIDPDDFFYMSQDHLQQISAPDAWDHTVGDSSIIIAVVDNGFDLEHEDLDPNYAVNQVEALGITGVDDDGNGLIDDVRGYDFHDSDPDPSYGASQMSGYRHGTHVAGIAAAAGNNGLGTVGITWNCRILPIKASSDDDPKFVSSASGLQGIVYAAAQGAAVVSLSWGSAGSYSQAAQDVMYVASQNGMVVVAAAGNEGNDMVFYPAGYHKVLGVAWVDNMDLKAPGASYGKTVDLSAPGSAIFSTTPGNGYGVISGSSMSAPMVAGAIALVKSLHPEWTADEIARQVAFSSDPIDGQNPLYINGLGSGRLNLELALIETELQEPLARLSLRNYSFSDSLFGNGNNIAEAGETITLSASLDNASLGGSSSVLFELATLDDTLGQLGVSTISVPVMPDTGIVLPGDFTFTVSENFRTGVARFLLSYSGPDALAGEDTLVLQVGRAPILVVDDDDGTNNVEGFYTNLLESLNLPYFHWDHSLLGTPEGETLRQFPLVIWFCEWKFPSLNEQDRVSLSSYLDDGGNLFLSGQDIGWDLNDGASQNATDESRAFYSDYLKAGFILDDAGEQSVFGTESDVIGGGITFDIYQPGRAEGFQFPDVFEPGDSAFAVFNYAADKGVGALRYDESFGLVYFGFGLEAINATMNSSPETQDPTRKQVFVRVLNYLHPVRFNKLQDQFQAVPAIPVSIRYDGPGVPPGQVIFNYSLPNSSLFNELSMTRDGDSYSTEMPTEGVSGQIQYYFEARDINFSWPYPVNGANNPFTVFVGADSVAPVISLDPVHNRLDLSPSYEVTAALFENTVLDTSALYLIFNHNQTPYDSVTMVYDEETGEFSGLITGEFSYGDTITYKIKARDQANPPNTSSTDIHYFAIGAEDFESGLGQWEWDSITWGLDSTTFFSGQYGLSTFPDQAYLDNVNGSIWTKLPLDFSSAGELKLMFRSRYEIENGDMGLVEIKVGDGNWQIVAGPFTGFVGQWDQFVIDLLPFIGEPECYLRFRFDSDSETAGSLFGWYVDDIRILQDGYITEVAVEENTAVPKSYLWPIYPNPVRDRSEITLDLGASSELKIGLYNLLGQRVRRIYLGPANRGRARWILDGRDDFGKKLPAGVYFLQVIADNYRSVQKLIIIR